MALGHGPSSTQAGEIGKSRLAVVVHENNHRLVEWSWQTRSCSSWLDYSMWQGAPERPFRIIFLHYTNWHGSGIGHRRIRQQRLHSLDLSPMGIASRYPPRASPAVAPKRTITRYDQERRHLCGHFDWRPRNSLGRAELFDRAFRRSQVRGQLLRRKGMYAIADNNCRVYDGMKSGA